jgi:hypothetical protein
VDDDSDVADWDLVLAVWIPQLGRGSCWMFLVVGVLASGWGHSQVMGFGGGSWNLGFGGGRWE